MFCTPKVPLSTNPHRLPNFDPILHQWRLLPWGGAGGNGGGPFLGIFATLAHQRIDAEVPLSLRAAFRPVLVAPPNVPLLFEAMIATSGFLGARTLVRGVVEGLQTLGRRAGDVSGGEKSFRKTSGLVGAVPTGAGTDCDSAKALGATAVLQTILLPAVRTAAELLTPETSKELRAARRKLGLASLTMSERKAKTDDVSRAVEARVLIAGLVRALLDVETGGRAKRSLESKSRPSTTPATSSAGNLSMEKTGTPAVVGRGDGPGEMNARRAVMVSAFEKTEALRGLLKPLVELEVGPTVFSCPTFSGTCAFEVTGCAIFCTPQFSAPPAV